MKNCLFWQPAGMGDILFLQKAARHLISKGYNIIWPVIPQFEYVSDYIKEINFVSLNKHFVGFEHYGKSEIIQTEDFVYVPLNHSHYHFPGGPMKTKYSLFSKLGFDISSEDWIDYVDIQRDEEKEDACRKILGIEKNEDFIFVNDLFASPPDLYKREMNIETNVKIVYHKPEHINQFTVFDLCWVLENAKEIHTVETSLCYLIEKVNTQGSLHMYSRKINGRNQHPNFDYVNHIYKKNWNYNL